MVRMVSTPPPFVAGWPLPDRFTLEHYYADSGDGVLKRKGVDRASR
jgi:hypothetical protein